MDKPKKGNTITIKLNGEDKAFKEETPKKESEVINEPTTKVIKINRNLADEDVILETAAAEESVDESFDWIIPESSENDIEEFKTIHHKNTKKNSPKKIISFSANSKKKPGRPIGPIIFSTIFAILLGTTIGIFMLKLVITGPSDEVSTEPPLVVDETGTDDNASNDKTTSFVIEQLTTYVIQGGAFAEKEGTEEIAKDLESKGVPVQTVEIDGKHYLFLGIADSIENAKALGNHYKENGITDVFAKPLLLDEKQFSDITEKEKTFIEAVPVIYQTLSTATSNAQVTSSISEESTKALAAIEKQLKVSGLKNDKIKNLNAELKSADEKVKEFQETKDEKSLTEAQQHLLNFLSLYFSL